jgi:putative ABC transport system ATP-binding protein
MCHSLVKVYESALGRVQAVRGVDLAVERGATAAIVGPSGSGKSSLLRMLAGLDRPTAGFVHVDGHDLHAMRPGKRARARSRLVTHVHQRPSDNLLAHLTALEQLERLTTQGGLALEALATLGIDDRAGHFPAELSGGEQQRLAFARALVTGSPVVIADEPTATLDTASASVVLDAVDTLAARGITVIIATHDARVLGRMSEIVALRDGAVASITSGSTEMAVIDRSGRIQLPPALRERFPGDRALLGWDDEGGQMTVTPP